MGKKDKTGLGRSVLKNRSKAGGHGKGKESWLHTSELDDGENLSKFNTQSVTEQSALDEFLATAELAGTEFIAEKLNVSVVGVNNQGGLPSAKEEQRIKQVQDEHKQFLQIPRRPFWDNSTTREQLEQLERESFLTWRRGLAELQEKDDIILTPFERNLEFWRQLWRVIERSDVIVQIVDARNPLLFRCEDLESYVNEVDSNKVSMLLVNKADLLTQEQREIWAAYFKAINVKAVFWSAVVETERLKQLETLEETNKMETESLGNSSEKPQAMLVEEHATKFLDLNEETNSEDSESEDKLSSLNISKSDNINLNPESREPDPRKSDPRESDPGDCPSEEASCIEVRDVCSPGVLKTGVDGSQNISAVQPFRPSASEDNESLISTCNDANIDESRNSVGLSNEAAEEREESILRIAGKDVEFFTSGHLLTGEELLAYCQWLDQQNCKEEKKSEDGSCTVIGLVGYPNVGKSSTINAILDAKKVPVSATPGRTKHFQTLFVDKNICLCDCPGLVFPSFVSTKAEMVVSGILPIDQMRDHVAPVALVCRRIPRSVLETVYGINLVAPQEGEDPHREPYAEELLNAYGYSKGYMTSQGRPDCPRSARYILKDYVNGRLLFCHSPSLYDPSLFQVSFSGDTKPVKKRPLTEQKSRNKTQILDRAFFKQEEPRSFTTATTGTEQYKRQMTSQSDSSVVMTAKPWKKHGNRNKKEKMRRLHQKDY